MSKSDRLSVKAEGSRLQTSILRGPPAGERKASGNWLEVNWLVRGERLLVTFYRC